MVFCVLYFVARGPVFSCFKTWNRLRDAFHLRLDDKNCRVKCAFFVQVEAWHGIFHFFSCAAVQKGMPLPQIEKSSPILISLDLYRVFFQLHGIAIQISNSFMKFFLSEKSSALKF